MFILKLRYILVFLLLTTCATGYYEHICADTKALNVKTDTLWKKTDIKVCWFENANDDAYAENRQIVHDIIYVTWNRTLSPEEVPEDEWVQFVGWEECVSGDNHDIKMKEGPGANRVNGLGTDATYVNFNYSNPDAPKWDIKRIAIHEFGHLLGLAHEHNRVDTGDQCSYEPQGTDGNRYYGRWDHDSVMNYCNSRYKDSVLSPSDQYWILRVYYPDYFIDECEPYIIED